MKNMMRIELGEFDRDSEGGREDVRMGFLVPISEMDQN